MSETWEELGYVGSNRRDKPRVSIHDYGKAAEAEKAKEALREMIEQLKASNKNSIKKKDL